MKKRIGISLLAIMLLTGCIGVSSVSEETKDPEIKVEDLDYNLEVWKRTDMEGYTYILTYTNTTEFPLTRLSIGATESDQEFHRSIDNSAIVKPGETSKISTQHLDSPPDKLDLEQINYDYIDKNGQEWSVYYDTRFEKYQVLKVERGE